MLRGATRSTPTGSTPGAADRGHDDHRAPAQHTLAHEEQCRQPRRPAQQVGPRSKRSRATSSTEPMPISTPSIGSAAWSQPSRTAIPQRKSPKAPTCSSRRSSAAEIIVGVDDFVLEGRTSTPDSVHRQVYQVKAGLARLDQNTTSSRQGDLAALNELRTTAHGHDNTIPTCSTPFGPTPRSGKCDLLRDIWHEEVPIILQVIHEDQSRDRGARLNSHAAAPR